MNNAARQPKEHQVWEVLCRGGGCFFAFTCVHVSEWERSACSAPTSAARYDQNGCYAGSGSVPLIMYEGRPDVWAEERGWTERWITKSRDRERDNKERDTGAKVSKTTGRFCDLTGSHTVCAVRACVRARVSVPTVVQNMF